MKSKIEIRQFQEFLMNSWPAKYYYFLNGWILRFTEGVTSRANSVFPIKYTGTRKTLDKDIELVEEAYKTHNLEAVFSIPDFHEPQNLEEKLLKRGYQPYDHTSVLGIKIEDIQIVCNYIRPGGIFLITVDAEPKRFAKSENNNSRDDTKLRLQNFKKELHPFFPSDISPKDLSEKQFPLLLRNMIVNVVEEKIHERKLEYFQIFNLKYKDTSQMYTFGCIFADVSFDIDDTGLYTLDFVSKDCNTIEINLPIITPLEKIYFDKKIPSIARKIGKKLKDFKISEAKINNYEKYYKYYPQYFESLI